MRAQSGCITQASRGGGCAVISTTTSYSRPLLHPGHDVRAAGPHRHQPEQRHRPGAALRRHLPRPSGEGDRRGELSGPGHQIPDHSPGYDPAARSCCCGCSSASRRPRPTTSTGKLRLQVRAYIKDEGSTQGPAGRATSSSRAGPTRRLTAQKLPRRRPPPGTSVSCSRTSASSASRSPARTCSPPVPWARDELLVEGVGLGDVGARRLGVPGDGHLGRIDQRLLLGAVGIGRGTGLGHGLLLGRAVVAIAHPACVEVESRQTGVLRS